MAIDILKTSDKWNRTSEVSWCADAEYALKLYRIIGRFLGIWPLDEQNIFIYFRVIFIIITQLSMSLTLLILLIRNGNCGDIIDITDVISLIICGFIIIIKISVQKIYIYKMSLIINTIIEDWHYVDDDKSRHVMLKYAYMGKVMLITFVSIALAVGAPLIIFRLPYLIKFLSGRHNASMFVVPLGPFCWSPCNMTAFSYSAYFLIQCIQLFINCTAFTYCDTYFFTIVTHACGQFEILNRTFQNINIVDDPQRQKLLIHKFVMRHQHLLVIANNFETIFNLIILAHILGNILVVGVTILSLLISLQTGDAMIFWQLVLRIFLICAQLYNYCYVGDKLSVKCEELKNAIYNYNWYSLPAEIVKDMRFIIMQTNYPFHLTAGKMYNMNIENFKNILKAIGSYVSVMRLMFLDES